MTLPPFTEEKEMENSSCVGSGFEQALNDAYAAGRCVCPIGCQCELYGPDRRAIPNCLHFQRSAA